MNIKGWISLTIAGISFLTAIVCATSFLINKDKNIAMLFVENCAMAAGFTLMAMRDFWPD